MLNYVLLQHGDLESFEKIPLGVPEESSAPKNSTSYYTKTETVVNSAAEVRRGEEEAEEERQIQLKAKRGRMDMFCTSKVDSVFPQFFHNANANLYYYLTCSLRSQSFPLPTRIQLRTRLQPL